MRQSPSAERLMQGANARERPKARNLLFRHADRLAAVAKLGSRRDAARKLEIKDCPREALRDGLPGVGLSSLFTRFDSRGDAYGKRPYWNAPVSEGAALALRPQCTPATNCT